MRKISNIKDFYKIKEKQQKISMVTCYDYSFAKLVDKSDVDFVLIGDSLGMVMNGYDSTIPVELEDVMYHCRAVRRGAPDVFIVADMPFLSYQCSVTDAVHNAGLLLKSGANAVKLEGGVEFVDVVAALTRASIPVMGHLGLTPQSVHMLGGHKLQARQEAEAQKLLDDALVLQKAGAFSLVLEMIPEQLAKDVTDKLFIPTIGIGAGRNCDGQVLVCYDLLGMNADFSPKFLKKYANLNEIVVNAFNQYAKEVSDLNFPTEKNIF